MSLNYDSIIVGQGLAGTTLAHTFLGQGKTVLVIDEVREVTSSKVAAGIWNPIVFKRYTQSFLAEELIQFNKVFYPEVENKVGSKFYNPLPYFKLFANNEDVEHWRSKKNNSEAEAFLTNELQTHISTQAYAAEYGAAEVKECGFLDVNQYITATRNYLTANGSFINEQFDYDALVLRDEGVDYKGYTAKHVVFCEGLNTLQNPYWSNLAFSPVKGEVLTIKASLPEKKAILNKSIFIVPIGENLYRVGSTYHWKDLENTPTQEAKEELLRKLEAIVKLPFEVVEHKAAVRPAAKDRRPFVGLHPQYPQVGVLNGLGSRGVLLAPFFAHQLTQHIYNGAELHPEVDVKRCFSK